MKVSLLDLSAQHAPLHGEIMAAIERVVRSQHFILGPEVDRLEKALAALLGTKHAIGVSSGSDALLVALMALGVGAGDEVVTSDYSFFATAGAVARLGARPVFVDIDPETLNLDVALVEQALTPRTRAVIPVHLFGLCTKMSPLLALCRARSLPVVEDAAQAIGCRLDDGRAAGTAGLLGCYSFFPSKNLGALGDGGLVVTDDDALAERLRALRAHGAKVKYRHEWIGGNFRLDALQAAVLQVKLPHLEAWTAARQRNAARYRAAFGATSLLARGDVVLPPDVPGHTYNQLVVRARRRDALREHLARAEVQTEVYYPVPFHLQGCFHYLGHKLGDFPESERAANDSVALPVAPGTTDAQIDFVVESVASFYASSPSSAGG